MNNLQNELVKVYLFLLRIYLGREMYLFLMYQFQLKYDYFAFLKYKGKNINFIEILHNRIYLIGTYMESSSLKIYIR